MPMPSAPHLLFSNRDVCPLWHFGFDQPDKLAEIVARLLKIGDVLAIGQGEEVVSANRQNELSQTGTRPSNSSILVGFP